MRTGLLLLMARIRVGSGSVTMGRRHEFRPDRTRDRLTEDTVDFLHHIAFEVPPQRIADGRELIGAPRAPQGNVHVVAVEHPSHGEMNHSPAESLLCEAIESLDGRKVLTKTRRQKFRITLAKVVAVELT